MTSEGKYNSGQDFMKQDATILYQRREKTFKFRAKNCGCSDARGITELLQHTLQISIITSVCVVTLRGVETPITRETHFYFNNQAVFLVLRFNIRV